MRTAVQGTCRLATVMGENLSRSVQRLGLEGEERARADGARARSEAVAVIRSGRTERHCVPPTHQRGGWRRQCENCVVYVGRKVVLKCARATVQIVCFFFFILFSPVLLAVLSQQKCIAHFLLIICKPAKPATAEICRGLECTPDPSVACCQPP